MADSGGRRRRGVGVTADEPQARGVGIEAGVEGEADDRTHRARASRSDAVQGQFPQSRGEEGDRAARRLGAVTQYQLTEHPLSFATSIRRSLPLRVVGFGVQATATLAKTSVEIAAIPVREGAKLVSGEISRETLSRNCWRNESRAWIEVRGLGDDDSGELGRVVVDAILAHPGVTSVSLNHPLSRAVVDIDGPGFSLRDLCRTVEGAEKRCGDGKDESVFARSLPGDGVVLATRALTVAVNATGLGIALTGRAMGLRPLPAAVSASVAFVDYQPWLRRVFADRLGGPTTDTVLTLAAAAAQTLTQSPTSLALGLTMQSMKAAEVRAEAQSWAQHEPELARHADQPRPRPGGRGRGRNRQDRSSGPRVVSRCCRP